MENVSYESVVDSLMYVMLGTRLDIAHASRVLRRNMSTPGRENRTTMKRGFGICMGQKIT